MSDLSKYLSDKLGDRVPDDIVKAAKEAGFSIDRTVVYSYVKGRHAKRPREATLKALAAGFGIDVRDLRELAGHPRGELGRFEVVDEADWLTYRQRKAFNDLILAFVTEEGAQDGTASLAEKIDGGPPAGDPGLGGAPSGDPKPNDPKGPSGAHPGRGAVVVDFPRGESDPARKAAMKRENPTPPSDEGGA